MYALLLSCSIFFAIAFASYLHNNCEILHLHLIFLWIFHKVEIMHNENTNDPYRSSIALSISALDAIRVFVLDRIKILLKKQQLPSSIERLYKKRFISK
jgi:hypothetical protein